MLDIIIPQYKENDNDIKPLLDSIINQEGIDFNLINVCIVNDNSDTLLSKSFLENYNKLNIKYIRTKENRGPGLARQYGIDNTFNKYIMFLDSDDELFDNKSLYAIFQFIIIKKPIYLVCNIAVEVYDKQNRKGLKIKKGKDTFPWMHGKVYDRSFLNAFNIRFCDKVRHLEDGYFTTCVIGSLKLNEISFLDYTVYRWKINEKSLTRQTQEFNYSVMVFDDFFHTPFYAYDFLSKVNSKYRYSYIVSAIFGIYIMLNSYIFSSDKLKEKREYYLNLLEIEVIKKRNLFIIIKHDDLIKLFENEKKELLDRNNIKEVYKNADDFINEYIKTKSSVC